MATGTFPKQIYFNAQMKMEVGVIVSQAVGTTVEGKKIAKAGTPVTGTLTNRATAVTAAGESDAIGVLVHDVDVTAGNANGTMCIFGFVNLDRLESDVQTKITEGVKGALKGHVTFLKDN